MEEGGFPVKLHVYDLSQGLARQLSASLLGQSIDAVWHTGIVVYGREYYYGAGISHDSPGRTPYGTPIRAIDLGFTQLPREVFEDYLREISPRFTPETYNLLQHNCNNFTNEVSQFLVGASIPSYILDLPNQVLNSPMGSLLLPMIQGLETTMRSGTAPQPRQFTPAAATPIMANSVTTAAVAREPVVSTSNSKVDAVAASASVAGKKKAPVADDPLVVARNLVQEEIRREFEAIMAAGTLQASEAASLATKRVMERHKVQPCSQQDQA